MSTILPTTTFDSALAAATAAAPALAGDALTAAVTAALTSVLSENRVLQIAVQTAAEQAANERAVLSSAQLWFLNNGHGLDELGAILGGHTTYGFAPDGDTEGLDPVQVAEAATEAYLRELARADRLDHQVHLLVTAE
ncbi:hypothetical protein [Curtobacterium sp. MCSS17_016]|uniref:hypothetical protein n=1 Tax=Curtobacterium sp. MCSS17_016 TaxID=2175644 RepID=UPI000DA9A257|nr:hypothetical protein [Curtobacterium sp. MCSS17_016]WIE81526.1 hypothetical protein DEJ19_020015 [Curtobacterium sp. MCSS17_016]